VPRLIVKLANEALIKEAVDGVKKVNKEIVVAATIEMTPDLS
jgi:hypothetical protein